MKQDENVYYRDEPIKDYEHDYIGFEEQVNMLKEGIDNNERIIGLISDYGSGKSSIISLLKNCYKDSDVKFYNINLLDPNGKNDDTILEAHKRFLLQFARQVYDKNSMKLSFVTKKLNPNYKSIKVSSKKITSCIQFKIFIILVIISFLYKNNILGYLNFLNETELSFLIPCVREFCKISGILSFILFIYMIFRNEYIFNYSKNNESQEFNEYDLSEMFSDISNDIKNDKSVIVIEDLDRITDINYIKKFLKEIYTYYSNINNFTFIIAITPKEFDTISDGNILDEKYKIFGSVLVLPKIENNDYESILKNLLQEKENVFKERFGINDIKKKYSDWLWLAQGEKLNIRKIKHRLNETINLYLTLINRFPGKYVNLKTCIAVTYLKDNYDKDFNDLIKEDKKSNIYISKLKQIIDCYLKSNNLDGIDEIIDKTSDNTNFIQDLTDLISNDFIDNNCEMYIYNYPKGNEVFNSYENDIYNCYLSDKEYHFDDLKCNETLSKNGSSLLKAIEERKQLGIKYPNNIFDRVSIFDFVFSNADEEEKMSILLDMLKISPQHISDTETRLIKIKDSVSFSKDYQKKYIELIKDDFRTNTPLGVISEIRLKLINVFFNNILILEPLYSDYFPIISADELALINSFNLMLKFINYKYLDTENIKYITTSLDKVYAKNNTEILKDFLTKLNSRIIDYFFKHSKIMEKLSIKDKKELYEKYKNSILLNDFDNISLFTTNINYSFPDLEEKVSNMFKNNIIDSNKYSNYINGLPNISKETLNYLEDDRCEFSINIKKIEKYYKMKDYYGYLKFKTILDGIIPKSEDQNITDVYEKLYSNEHNIFKKYIVKDNEFLKFIFENDIYKKYDLSHFQIMSFYNQNYKLLDYAFSNFTEINQLSEYVLNMTKIDCSEKEMFTLINVYNDKFKILNEESIKAFYKACKSKKAINRIKYLRKKTA